MEDTMIPVTIITGFLGSGKTTILNRLLRDKRLTDTAVIVNEFGEIGIDHLLVESALDQIVLMDNGCLCCTVRGALVDTLEDLLRRVREGKIPAFREVMIETTGLADPGPIIQSLITDAAMARDFSLRGIVATVDGVSGAATLEEFDEARAQAAMADLLLVTKADMAEARVEDVTQSLKALNPGAEIHLVRNGEVDPALVLSLKGADGVPGELQTAEAAAHGAGQARDHVHTHQRPGGHGSPDHVHESHGHNWNIQSASIIIDEPLDWSVVSGWLEWITALRGPDILRIKGLISVAGLDGPVLVHGVQQVFHPPRMLAAWPGDDRRSRIIIIARDIPEKALRQSLPTFSATVQAA